MATQLTPFHLAFPVRDLASTREFYEGVLGCEIGRTSEKWIDFNFFGHQLSAHVKPEELATACLEFPAAGCLFHVERENR